MIFKVDMMEAYDHVSWNILVFVLKEMDFGQKWRTWVRVCISHARFSVLVNEKPKGYFKSSRRLR